MGQPEQGRGMTRDELIEMLRGTIHTHSPEHQKEINPVKSSPGRCMWCNYTRHPCEVAEICELVLDYLENEDRENEY